MSKNKTTTETAIQIESAINEWEAIGLSKDAWDGCIKKRQVLTLEEAAKVVKALDDGEEYDLHSCFGWSYIDPNALSVLDKWVEANANGDGPSGYGYLSVQGRLKKVSDHCIARLAKVTMRGFIFYDLPTDIQRRIKNAKAKLRRADQPNIPKADPDAPLPTAPPEWKDGRIVLTGPAKPLRGHGHERVRWLGSDCPREEKSARKWFVERLLEGPDRGQDGHAAEVTEGSGKPWFVSPEAFQLWNHHKAFWLAQQHRAKEEKASVKKTIRRQATSEMKAVAADTGLTVTALRSKLRTLQTMLADKGTLPLALELLRAAEEPLLQAVLQGASIRYASEVSSRSTIHALDINCGTFFKVSDVDGRSPLLPFWLAATRIRTAASRQKLKLNDVSTIHLEAASEAELEAITVDILPHLTGLQQLTLTVLIPTFSTKVLPRLPKLSRIILKGENNLLRLEDLDRQPALTWCVIEGSELILEISEADEPHFQRIRLDLSQGTHSIGDDGLRKDHHMPEQDAKCLKAMDMIAARVLLNMVSDYSGHPSPPQWWRSYWALPDVLSEVSGKISDITGSGLGPLPDGRFAMEVEEAHTKKRHRYLIPLGHQHNGTIGSLVAAGQPLATRSTVRYVNCSSDMLKLNPAHVAIWIASDAALSFDADTLDSETAKLLALRRGQIRLVGSISLAVLTEMVRFRGELVWDAPNLDPRVAKVLSRFAGSKLTLSHLFKVKRFTEAVAAHLAAVQAELAIVEDDNEVEIPLAAAVALATHRRKLSFVGWPIFMDAASVTALMAHPDCDLGPYRPHRFERPDGKKIYSWEIQPEGHMARISHGVVGGETKQSLKELSQNYWIRRDQIDKLLKERFEKGFTEVAVKKPVLTGNPPL